MVGRYVTIEGKKRRFFGMVTDISLGVTDEEITISPPDTADAFTAEILEGTATYGSLHVLPMLTIGGDVNSVIEGPQPVKTVPSHFSRVKLASEAGYGTGLRQRGQLTDFTSAIRWIWRRSFVSILRNW